jgi:hypothetical protein
MGYSLAWLATRGKPIESLFAELNLRRTGTAGQYTDDPMVGAPLEDGWYLLVARGCDHRMITDPVLKTISRGCRMIACSVEEHMTWSLTMEWDNGRELWSVYHQGDEEVHNLTASGALPDFFASIRDEIMAEQAAEGGADAGVDCVFEAPLELARRITGFRHSSDENVSGQFEILLESTPAMPAKPWWRFW